MSAGALKERTDGDLVAGVLAGDQHDADMLVARFDRRLDARLRARTPHWLADRDDLRQETWARAWSSLHRFDQSRPLWPWLRRIADNLATDHGRRYAPGGTRREVTFTSRHDIPADPDRVCWEDRQALTAAFNALPARHQAVLQAVEVDELDHRVAATTLGISHAAVRQRAVRARAALRDLYGGLAAFPPLRWLLRVAAPKAAGTAPALGVAVPLIIAVGIGLALGPADTQTPTRPTAAPPSTATISHTPLPASAPEPQAPADPDGHITPDGQAAADVLGDADADADRPGDSGRVEVPTVEVPAAGVAVTDGPEDSRGHVWSGPEAADVGYGRPEVTDNHHATSPAHQQACAAVAAAQDVVSCHDEG